MSTKEILTSKETCVTMQNLSDPCIIEADFVTFCIDTMISCCSAVGCVAEIMLSNTQTKAPFFFLMQKK